MFAPHRSIFLRTFQRNTFISGTSQRENIDIGRALAVPACQTSILVSLEGPGETWCSTVGVQHTSCSVPRPKKADLR